MKLALQPLRRNPRAKSAPPNLSICAQCASIDSAISTFRTLSKICRAVTVSRSKFFRYRSSDAKRHACKPFRMNTCESVSKQRTLTTFRINTYEKPRGRGAPLSASPASSLQHPVSRTICATWRLYPLWPQSIAHTSRHHGGCTILPRAILAKGPTLLRSRLLCALCASVANPILLALCFHTLTNPFLRNPFCFTSIQIPRGVGVQMNSKLATRHSSLATAPKPIPCLTPSKALHYRAHLLQRRREGKVR